VSSALDSLQGIIVEEYVKRMTLNLSNVQLGYVSKLVSAVCWLVSFCIIFIIADVGNIFPVSDINWYMQEFYYNIVYIFILSFIYCSSQLC
jgi:hypothetical protein